MKRIIKSLNSMSFSLPEGWDVVSDKYNIMNGQGFINTENYLSQSGKVISLFEIHRAPDEFFEYYQNLVESFSEKDQVVLEREFSLKFGEYTFPTYILKGTKEPLIYIVQTFVNCGDKLACFMFNIEAVSENNKKLIAENQHFIDLTKILRTIE